MEENQLIKLEKGNTQAIIIPSLGALVDRFLVNGKDILFPSQIFETESGPKRRGGIPILFPNADPITENQPLFKLKQHGFAREMPWKTETVTKDEGFFSLNSNEETLSQFPYEFSLVLKVKVEESNLIYNLEIINPSNDKTLPIAPGFHPYFNLPSNERPNLKTNIKNFNLHDYVWDTSPSYPIENSISYSVSVSHSVSISVSNNFKILTIWSQKDKPFICFEPWVGPRNAILHPGERIEIKPRDKNILSMEIKVP